MNELYRSNPLPIFLNCKNGSFGVFSDWKWWLVASERLSLEADILDTVGSFWAKRLLGIVFDESV